MSSTNWDTKLSATKRAMPVCFRNCGYLQTGICWIAIWKASGPLFSKKRRITFGIEFVFKKVSGDSSSA
jgi:hypothetical protein